MRQSGSGPSNLRNHDDGQRMSCSRKRTNTYVKIQGLFFSGHDTWWYLLLGKFHHWKHDNRNQFMSLSRVEATKCDYTSNIISALNIKLNLLSLLFFIFQTHPYGSCSGTSNRSNWVSLHRYKAMTRWTFCSVCSAPLCCFTALLDYVPLNWNVHKRAFEKLLVTCWTSFNQRQRSRPVLFTYVWIFRGKSRHMCITISKGALLIQCKIY